MAYRAPGWERHNSRHLTEAECLLLNLTANALAWKWSKLKPPALGHVRAFWLRKIERVYMETKASNPDVKALVYATLTWRPSALSAPERNFQ
jgi:hypothetical protein